MEVEGAGPVAGPTGRIPPIVKWSGSKARVAPVLSALFTKSQRFVDPFVGSAAMIPFARAEVVYASDIQFELIELLKKIRDCPNEVANGYASRWARLQQEGHSAYYEIRADFNSKRDPFDLLFLSRTCVNGLIRFNRNGDFNNSLHHTRPGIHPERLRAIAQQWSLFLQGAELTRRDYRDVIREARSDDFFFLDPPYANNRGRYQPGTFDPKTLGA